MDDDHAPVLPDPFDSSGEAGLPILTPATYPGELPAPDPAPDVTPSGSDPTVTGEPPATPPAPVVDEHPALGLNRDNPFPDWDQPAGDPALPTLTPATYPGESPFPDDDDDHSPLTSSGTIDGSDGAPASGEATTDGDGNADNPYENDYFSYSGFADSGGVDRAEEGGQ